ncbi:LysE family translocator [Corynebacterium tuscaniense]|uniref:LysE family translocator n=1 Tax=Corynebacterium tuscaniense TaxID=302449 RepID=UPI00123939E0|nr:LysE family translocator [Corynebacterium tuscaniense]KAA8737487.1 LysE family translocator [Corynebacterium tuscaniense]
MNPADLAAIIAVNVVGAASPGPDVVLLTRMATRSRKHAMAANLGIHVGVLMWTSLTVFGAAALLTAFPWMLELIQVIGGSWIMYMGISAVRQGWRDRLNPPLDLEEAVQRLGSVRSAFTTGVATNLSNPKIVLFLAALVAPLLPTSPTVGVALTVIAALWLSSFLLFIAYCLLVSTDRVRRKLFHAGPYIDMGAGTFFIIAGTVLILRGLLGLAG